MYAEQVLARCCKKHLVLDLDYNARKYNSKLAFDFDAAIYCMPKL